MCADPRRSRRDRPARAGGEVVVDGLGQQLLRARDLGRVEGAPDQALGREDGVLCIDYGLKKAVEKAPKDHTLKTLAGPLRVLASLLLWSLIVVLALDNMGVHVTALLAGLGVGGIAVRALLLIRQNR